MSKQKLPKVRQVFIPLTSFYLDDIFLDNESPAKLAKSWDIPDTDIKLGLLSKRVVLDKNAGKPEFGEDVFIEDKLFGVKSIFPDHGESLSFNSGFLFPFMQNDPDSLTIFPHTFENKIRTPLIFLRLFCPGNLFAPYGFIDNADIISFYDFHQGKTDGHSYLHIRRVEEFLKFYKKYSDIIENLRQRATQNPKSIFESWYKRINNGIYFLSQTYFTSERNQMNPDAKDKNNLRLIYLCTALDALIGSGNPNGEKLASKADLLLCNIIGSIKKEIENFYNERSRYIHANPDTMGGMTSNKTIDRFILYIQKIILMSLELYNDPEFVKAITNSNQKHWFGFYETPGLYTQYSIKDLTRKAFEKVFKNKDGYELADANFIESKINIWANIPGI